MWDKTKSLVLKTKWAELDQPNKATNAPSCVVILKISLTPSLFSMASSSWKSMGKREPQDDWEIKPPILKKHKVVGFAADSLQPRVETKSDRISVKEVAPRTKTLYVGNLSRQIKISDIINFFKDVGQVVRVKLIENGHGALAGFGFVEFSSAHQANKALEKKNGQHFHGRDIFLDVLKSSQYFPRPRPKYWIDHKVAWYEDYLRRESEDKELFAQANLISVEETEEGVDPDFVEEVDIRKKTLFVANLSPQTKMSDIINFFKYVARTVSVRLIVNHEGKHVGCGFVEFASANEAKKALEKKNGEYLHDHKIFLDVAKIAPYPPRSKYNLAEKLWHEDYLRRDSLLVEDDDMEGLVEEVSLRKKTLDVANLSPETEISDIINFFKDVGEVVHVRLVVDHEGEHAGHGFVEFASADEAKKALEKKNGEKLQDHEISLGAAKRVPYTQGPMYCIDHKVWYEDYLRRESLLVEEEEDDMKTVEGLVEEVAVREKTIFVANLSPETGLSHIHNLFRNAGQVVSVQLIVDQEGKHVGCAFVEFASPEEANMALEMKKQGRGLFLDVVKIAPYPLRPKFNLAEKLWKKMMEENRQDIEDEVEDDFEPIPKFCGTKTIFVDDEESF